MVNKSKYPEDLNEKRPDGAEVMQPSKNETHDFLWAVKQMQKGHGVTREFGTSINNLDFISGSGIYLHFHYLKKNFDGPIKELLVKDLLAKDWIIKFEHLKGKYGK